MDGTANSRDGASAPRLLPRFPWPLPAAIATACGIVAAAEGVAAWFLLLLLPAAWPLRFLLLRDVATDLASPSGAAADRAERTFVPAALLQRHSGPVSSFGVPPPRALVSLLLPLLCVGLGYARFQQWEARPDPLAGMRERPLTLSGSSDGRILTLDEPSGARVAIAPAGALPVGEVELRGTLIEASGKRNPGGFDYRGYLRRRGVQGQVLVEELIAAAPRSRPLDRLRAGVTAGLPPEPAALMEAMTLGVRDELGDLRDVFAAAGLAHVLALSGLHVGLLMAAAGWLLAPLGVLRYPLLLLLDFGYMLLVGATPSIVRAAVMVAVVLAGLWLGAGRVRPWPALGLAALVTLIARPAWLFDISLQLSYGAVAGILLFSLPLAARLRGDPPLPWWHPRVSLLGAAVVSASAQSLTLPLVASSFGSLPLLSPLVNVVALPFASLLVPLGFSAGLLGLVSLPLAGLVNELTLLPASTLLALARAGSALPALGWGEVEAVGYLYFLAGVAGLALVAHGLLRPWRGLLVVSLAMLLSGATPSLHPPPELVVLDVGQGDSILLRLPGRVEVLVDAGGTPFSDFDVGGGIVLPALRALGVDEIELLVSTHADVDHSEGLLSVLDGMPVQLLAIGAREPGTPAFDRLMTAAERKAVPVREFSRGERIELGAATLEVLNPPPGGYGTSNDDSLAFAVYLHGVPRVLLLGDISQLVERDLTPPQVDVLVAAHHGSASSTSPRLLRNARPRTAVISVGRNGYGHPSAAVLRRLREAGVAVHITRDEGAVRLPLH